ncbi:MAG: hypothetical protein JXR03_18000 [Cyclobacteriaceae bacterium]
MLRVFFYITICLSIAQGIAQDTELTAVPYRPKVVEFGVETLMDYQANSYSENFGSAKNEVERDRLIKAKVGIPLIMKDNKLFGIQLKYYQHRFMFDTEDNPINYDLYLHLDARKFTSTGIRTFYRQDINENQQLSIIGGAELKSDQIKWSRNTTKYFISGIYTWKPSSNTKIGTGFVLNQMMQLTTFYPLFIYEKGLSPKWTLDLTLPKSAAIRHKVNSKNYLIAKTELRGWRYNLTNAIENGNQDLTLRKADLQFSTSWEHEVHDWLWFGVDVGYTKNLRYYLANPGDRGRDALIDVKSKDAKYIKFSVFIVPPKRFYR